MPIYQPIRKKRLARLSLPPQGYINHFLSLCFHMPFPAVWLEDADRVALKTSVWAFQCHALGH